MIFKNLLLYYLSILVPLALLVLGMSTNFFNPAVAIIGILVYALIYHPLISGLRLVSLNKIPRSKLYHNLIPGWNTKYFAALFFGR